MCSELGEDEKAGLAEESRSCPDPVVSRYPLPSHLSAVTEKLERLIQDYEKERGDRIFVWDFQSSSLEL